MLAPALALSVNYDASELPKTVQALPLRVMANVPVMMWVVPPVGSSSEKFTCAALLVGKEKSMVG